MAPDFPDGVWFCDLAAVADGATVARVVASTMEVRQQERMTVTESILDALAEDQVLVIVDNCEHVTRDVAALATAIVARCRGAAVIGTSRERLGVDGEQIFSVEMLDPDGAATELFCQRARLANPAFELGLLRETVVSICQQLDGMPLAIELAAARMRVLSPSQLLDRLGDRFRLLRARRKEGITRHRTLEETVEWSYSFLSASEAAVMDRLSVFWGSFDLAAAVAVAAPDHDDIGTVDLLDGLVERSLVMADPSGPTCRYRLLETMRQFGEARLRNASRSDELKDRHACYFAGLARAAQAVYEGPACLRGAAIFRADWDNLRAAFQWALHRRMQNELRDIVESSAWYGYFGLLAEVGEWAVAATDAGFDQPALYGVASGYAHLAGEHARSIVLAEQGIALAPHRTHPDTRWCHWGAGVAHTHAGNLERVAPAEDDQEASALEAGDLHSHAIFAAGRAIWAAAACPLDAPRYGERGLALANAVGSPAVRASAHLYAGAAESAAGDVRAAKAHYQRAFELATLSGNRCIEALTVAWMTARTPAGEREAACRTAIEHLVEMLDWMSMWVCLESLAAHWAVADPPMAGLILGHLQEHRIGHAGVAKRRARALESLAAAGADGSLAAGRLLSRSELLARVRDRLASGSAG